MSDQSASKRRGRPPIDPDDQGRTTCKIGDCDRAVQARGRCEAHYQRWRSGNDDESPVAERGIPCSVEGCDATRKAGGKCKRHWGKDYAQRPEVRQRRKERFDAIAAEVSEYKLKLGCADCGYAEHPAALDFDHRDPATKEFSVGARTRAASPKKLWAEIAKCDVVCANCHRVRTWGAVDT